MKHIRPVPTSQPIGCDPTWPVTSRFAKQGLQPGKHSLRIHRNGGRIRNKQPPTIIFLGLLPHSFILPGSIPIVLDEYLLRSYVCWLKILIIFFKHLQHISTYKKTLMCSQFFWRFCRVQVFAEIPITSIHAIWAKAAGNQLTEIHWMVEALRRHCLRSILRYQNMWISGI